MCPLTDRGYMCLHDKMVTQHCWQAPCGAFTSKHDSNRHRSNQLHHRRVELGRLVPERLVPRLLKPDRRLRRRGQYVEVGDANLPSQTCHVSSVTPTPESGTVSGPTSALLMSDGMWLPPAAYWSSAAHLLPSRLSTAIL